MTDLTDLLDSAAGAPGAPSNDVVHADLVRGRRALVRRRWARTSAATLITAAAVSAAFVAPLGGSGDAHVGIRIPAAGQTHEDPPNPGVDLVSFDGRLRGAKFRPAEIPEGWSLSGDAYRLLISPPNISTSDDYYVGKIHVFMFEPLSGEPLPKDAEVAVGDRTGYVNRSDPSALQVWLPLPKGDALRASAPASTGWDEATLGRFLGGIAVLDGAKGRPV